MKFLPLLLTGLTGFGHWACQKPDPDPIQPVFAERKLTGKVLLPGGDPARGVRVRLYSVSHVPLSLVPVRLTVAPPTYQGITDTAGEFRPDSIPGGLFNLLAEHDEWIAWEDSILLPDPDTLLPTLLLQPTGSLSGRVAVQPFDDVDQVVVGVLGTPFATQVDSRGWFQLGPMPGGRFAGLFRAASPDYSPFTATLRIQPGRKDTVEGVFSIPYLGIPVVTGLRVGLDTLMGVVHLSWARLKSPLIQEYLVFRDSLSAVVPSTVPVGRTVDSNFSDTLYSAGSGPRRLSWTDTNLVPWQYRVLVRTRSGETLTRNLPVTLTTHSPAMATSTVDLVTLTAKKGVDADTAGSGQEVEFRVNFRNRIRRMKSATLQVDSKEPSAEKVLDAREGFSLFTLTTPKVVFDRMRITVRLKDEFGDTWVDSLFLVAQEGRPKPVSRFRTPMPRLRTNFGSIALGGKIYVIGGVNPKDSLTLNWVEVFDPETEIWSSRAPLQTARWGMAVTVHDGKILVTGGKSGPAGALVSTMEIYDPAMDSWKVRYQEYSERLMSGGTVFKDRLYSVVFPENLDRFMMEQVSLTSNEKVRVPLPTITDCCTRQNGQVVVAYPTHMEYIGVNGDQIWHAVRAYEATHGPMPTDFDYLAIFSVDTSGAGPGHWIWVRFGYGHDKTTLKAFDRKAFFFGGYTSAGDFTNTISVFDVTQYKWLPYPPTLLARRGVTIVESGKSLYLLGGFDRTGNLTAVEEYVP